MEKKPQHPKKLEVVKNKHYEHQHKLPELKKFLDEHWEEIDQIYFSVQKQCGVKKPRHIPHRIKTQLMEFGVHAGSSPYDPSSVLFDKGYEFQKKEGRGNDLPALIHYWIHEAVHGTGKTKYGPRFSSTFFKVQSGISLMTATIDSKEKERVRIDEFAESMNEAVTEHIASAILAELSRRGIFKQSDELIIREAAYQVETEQFTKMISGLAGQLEVSEEVIWRAFVRQYFTGEIPLEKFYAMLRELGNDSQLESTQAKIANLLGDTMAIEEDDSVNSDENKNDSLSWSKRGLRLDQ